MRLLGIMLLLCTLAWGELPPLKIGILHSQTGSFAPTEQPLIDAALLAVEDINSAGGLLGGRRLEAVVVDGASDPARFAAGARKLVEQGVCTLFGTWSSDCRRAVLPVLHKADGVLFYGVQYEGGEDDPLVVYTGLTPNQQLYPALQWMHENIGSRAFLVGSESFFSRAVHTLARLALIHHGALEVGEVLRPMGPTDYTGVMREIAAARPDFIMLTQDLGGTESFFQAYKLAGLKAPVLSLSVAELELSQMKIVPAGHFVCRGYFSSLDIPENRRFLEKFRGHYGAGRPVDDNVQTAYFQVRAYAAAVERAHSDEPGKVRAAARGVILDTPSGLVRIDPRTRHTWRTCRLGQILPSGRIEIKWSSEDPVRPEPLLGGSSR